MSAAGHSKTSGCSTRPRRTGTDRPVLFGPDLMIVQVAVVARAAPAAAARRTVEPRMCSAHAETGATPDATTAAYASTVLARRAAERTGNAAVSGNTDMLRRRRETATPDTKRTRRLTQASFITTATFSTCSAPTINRDFIDRRLSEDEVAPRGRTRSQYRGRSPLAGKRWEERQYRLSTDRRRC